MLGKVTSIDALMRTVRAQEPQTPYYTLYHGFQVTKKLTSDWALRNSTQSNLDEALKTLKNWLVDNSQHGGQFTLYTKTAIDKQDTSGFTTFIELMPQGYQQQGAAIAGVQPFTPSVSHEDIEARISGAISKARLEWDKDLHIRGLQARIEELENEEPEGVNIGEVAVGLAETLINKIPEATIGKIFENLFSKAEGATVDKLADMGNKYMNFKIQQEAMKQAAQARKQPSSNQSTDNDDDENDEIEYV